MLWERPHLAHFGQDWPIPILAETIPPSPFKPQFPPNFSKFIYFWHFPKFKFPNEMIAHFPIFAVLFLLPLSQSAIPNPKWTHLGAKSAEIDFMKNLFHQMQNGGKGNGPLEGEGIEWANSIVGYSPTIQAKNCSGEGGKWKEIFGLEFELNELKEEEKLIGAELHLFFPGNGKTRNGPKQIELAKADCQKREMFILGRKKEQKMLAPGWAIFDALSMVQNGGNIFVQLKKHGKYLNWVQLNRLAHLHRPFLVIYSKMEEGGGGRTKRNIRATLTNYGDEEEIQRHMETARKTAEYYAYGMARGKSAGEGMRIGGKAKEGNKGPGGVLNRRRQKNWKKGRKLARSFPNFDANDPMLGFGTQNSPWQRERLIQSPNFGNSLNDIRALEENRYKMMEGKGRRREKENEAETKVVLMGKEEGNGGEKKCGMHNLTVDFRQLGWADRIIAPKRFEAGFCGGECNYPLEEKLNDVSNHAILQSLLFQHQPPNGPIPPVCCAPTQFDSLTLLYFDERENVVLKNYPRMAVLQCGCI